MKKHGIKKRVLATLMTACMIVGAVPGGALADVGTQIADTTGINNPGEKKYTIDGSECTTGNPDVILNKTAVYDSDDDTYTIKLTAKTSDELTSKRKHVVFLMDASGSMNFCEDNADELNTSSRFAEFIAWAEKIFGNDPHIHYYYDGLIRGYMSGCTKIKLDESIKSRVSIATEAIAKIKAILGDDNIDYDYTWFNDAVGKMNSIEDLEKNLSAQNGTDLKKGVDYALDIFSKDKDKDKDKDKEQILVILADGQSTSTKKQLVCTSNHKHNNLCHYKTLKNYYPEDELNNFKNNSGKVYTLGFTFSSDQFDALASDGCAFNASNEEDLKKASEQIGQQLTTKIVDHLGANVEYVDDSIEAQGYNPVVTTESTKDEETGENISENVITFGNLTGLSSSSGVELSYKVKLKDKQPGNNALNGRAVLNYANNGVNRDFEFPTPSVNWAKFTVNFVTEDNQPVNMSGTWTDWTRFADGSDMKFNTIQEIPSTINGEDGKLYYLKSVVDNDGITNYAETNTAPYMIKSPTAAKEYAVTVTVSDTAPQPETYTVIYDAAGGSWNLQFQKTGYVLNATEGANKLTRAGMNGSDRIEVLAGADLPTKEGYTFDGWYLDQNKFYTQVNIGAVAADRPDHTVTLEAHWKQSESQSEYVTYSVSKHYIAPGNTYYESVELGQRAEKGSRVSTFISESTVDQKANEKITPFGLDYLYDHTTVSFKEADGDYGAAETYNADTTVFSGDCKIDIYYYGDSWKDAKEDGDTDSETGGDGIADIKQVLVKFGNRDENGTVSGTGTVQVFTLTDGQNTVTPSEDGITKTPANGYKFEKWTKNNSTTASNPFTEQTGVKGGDTINFYACFTREEPVIPNKPVGTDLVAGIIVECVNTTSGHEAKTYDVTAPNSVNIGEVRSVNGKYVSEITVLGEYYASMYNTEVGYDHDLTNVNDVTYTLVWNVTNNEWMLYKDGEWIEPTNAITLIDTVKVDCSNDHHDPEIPTDDQIKEVIRKVTLVHTGSNASHEEKEYDLIDGSYTVASASNATAIVTVNAAKYVTEYNKEYGTHAVQGDSFMKVIFTYVGDGFWNVEDNDLPVEFVVKCDDKKEDEKPKLPENKELKNLFGETITVSCTTDNDHETKTFGLLDGSYSVTRDNENDYAAVVTVRAAKYITAYLDGTHTNAGDDASRVELYYDVDTAKWYATDSEISINFKAKCEKETPNPDKQYSDIKFIVVNGTFTENGQTEITKSFEVGTKLTLTDIPASKGKSSRYCDQTWDKYPLGYVVKEEGTTFTITYRWRSNSDSDSDSDSTTTRGRATNAAGKSGRWILEGGEFTEDNGKFPSNEYLKIGDTIYGFYTHGFAIDFDRPEYYTDAAIQAKGGYRDATGTWRLNGWWFCYDDGTFPHNEWVYLTWNGHSDWYFFDVDGWMEDGWFFWNNNWYYLHTQYDNTRGHMYTGWHEIDGKWYYFNTASDKGTLGAMLANTTTPDGYKVDASGAMIQ